MDDEAGPARLVGRAEAGAGVPMEVLVEPYEVAPTRVFLQQTVGAVRRPVPFASFKEQ